MRIGAGRDRTTCGPNCLEGGVALRANLASPAIGARRHNVLHQVLHAQDVLAVVFDEVRPIPAGFVGEVAVHAAAMG